MGLSVPVLYLIAMACLLFLQDGNRLAVSPVAAKKLYKGTAVRPIRNALDFHSKAASLRIPRFRHDSRTNRFSVDID
jgi:hypothetical protein